MNAQFLLNILKIRMEKSAPGANFYGLTFCNSNVLIENGFTPSNDHGNEVAMQLFSFHDYNNHFFFFLLSSTLIAFNATTDEEIIV